MTFKITPQVSKNSATPAQKLGVSTLPKEGIEKVKESWQEWNTSGKLSSSRRQSLKLESLQTLAKDLAQGDPSLSGKVDFATKEFFKRGLHLGNNCVQNLINCYCNFVEEFSGLEVLADEQLLSNTWRSQ